MTTDAIIKFDQINKSFGKFQALKNVNLTVNRGDFFAFIGPNGAGKSTSLRILLGLIKANSGQAELLGHDSAHLDPQLLKEIAYLPSEAPLYKNRTVQQVMDLSAASHGLKSRAESQRLIQLFELDTHKKVGDLSLGNRKKVAIVTALHHPSQVLILDEPTSGLDPLMQEIFWQEIKSRHQAGATVFVSSHDLTEVQKYCQQAGLIRQGEIIFQDQIERLIQDTFQRVTINGLSQVEGLTGIENFTQSEGQIHFRYMGHVTDLLNFLQAHQDQIEQVFIQPPSLDEVLHHYYQKAPQTESEGR